MPTAIPESLAEKIISEKIREWELKKKKQKEQKIEDHPFLAIARDFGCGEEEIIPKLGKALNWKVYGRNLLDHLAKSEILSRDFIETLDEQEKSGLDNWVNFLIRSGALLQKDYVLKISRLIKVIATHESAIFLGRGAPLILKDKKEGLKIKLTAPFAHRVQNIMTVRNISKDEAEKMVLQKDKERKQFLQHYFDRDTENLTAFDIVFNTMTLDTGTICKVICLIFEEKNKRA